MRSYQKSILDLYKRGYMDFGLISNILKANGNDLFDAKEQLESGA